jgi:hypothetical protein
MLPDCVGGSQCDDESNFWILREYKKQQQQQQDQVHEDHVLVVEEVTAAVLEGV